MGKFRPTVYSNQRPILTPESLGNHPLAVEYCDYIKHVLYPVDFKQWIVRRENARNSRAARNAMTVEAARNDPYCRSPLKLRRFSYD